MWLQVVNETLPALVKLRDQGLVKFIGITGLPLKIFPYILDRCAAPRAGLVAAAAAFHLPLCSVFDIVTET